MARIIKPGVNVNPNYGLFEIPLTNEQIDALKAGDRLYATINHNEYGLIIMVEKKDEKEDE